MAIQFRRGTAARWAELNPVLASGQPGYEYGTNKFKIGDGKTAWNDLPYTNKSELCSVKTINELPAEGNPDMIYKVSEEKILYQWNTTDSKYEPLNSGNFDLSVIKIINGGDANE